MFKMGLVVINIRKHVETANVFVCQHKQTQFLQNQVFFYEINWTNLKSFYKDTTARFKKGVRGGQEDTNCTAVKNANGANIITLF